MSLDPLPRARRVAALSFRLALVVVACGACLATRGTAQELDEDPVVGPRPTTSRVVAPQAGGAEVDPAQEPLGDAGADDATPESAGDATRAAIAAPDDPRVREADAARQAKDERLAEVVALQEAVREVISIGLADRQSGELLRDARSRAPDVDRLEREFRDLQRRLASAKLHRVRLAEEQRLAPDDAARAEAAATLRAQSDYESALEGYVEAAGALLRESKELLETLDSQLLWIGSAEPIDAAWAESVVSGALWLFGAKTWTELGGALARGARTNPLHLVVSVLLLLAAAGARRPAKRGLRDVAGLVGRVATDSFALTARALAYTFLLALPAPLALASVGSLLVTTNASRTTSALGEGLLVGAAVLLLLDFARQLCRAYGLADVHFRWNDAARKRLARHLKWFIAVQVAAAFVVSACEVGGPDEYGAGLGRMAFLSASVGLSVFLAIVFRPSDGVLSQVLPRDSIAWRLRRLWYGVLVLLPFALAVVAGAGFYYTATEVQGRFFTTGLVVLSGVVVYSLLQRALIVTRKRLAVQQAREKLAQMREARAREAGGEEEEASGEAVPELDLQTIDVGAVSQQSLSFIRLLVGGGTLAILWLVWQDVMPALARLDSVYLIDPSEADAVNGVVAAEGLAWWDVMLAGLSLLVTYIAARNLPPMVSLALSTRFHVDPGARYAASTLTRYFVVAVGVLVVTDQLDVDWSKAQWIIAALGVGLGFGLQEIVANFVSGIIILFERPIRIGDTVTVGADSGTVSKLQIRATTITDWDNKEILVPNKSFITERVVNWTLSNSVTRLLLPVGVAYGTDVNRAREAITDAVKSVPNVLDTPAPSVLFLGFGDSSLNFEVRAFVDDLGKRLTTLHELHVAINANFAEAGIEIPFPQRDLHIRSDDTRGPRANGGGDRD